MLKTLIISKYSFVKITINAVRINAVSFYFIFHNTGYA